MKTYIYVNMYVMLWSKEKFHESVKIQWTNYLQVSNRFEGLPLTEVALVLSSGQKMGCKYASSQQYYHKLLLTTLR